MQALYEMIETVAAGAFDSAGDRRIGDRKRTCCTRYSRLKSAGGEAICFYQLRRLYRNSARVGIIRVM